MWLALRLELALWRRHGRAPTLWWRDDDAREASPALAKLLALAHRHGIPVTLAVIPAGSRIDDLRQALAASSGVVVAQHGVTHCNVQRPGEPQDEFGASASVQDVARALVEGAVVLRELPNSVPLYVPPWNHVGRMLPVAAQRAGMQAISAHGLHGKACDEAQRGNDSVRRLDVHVDLLRWRGGPRFRGAARILWRLIKLLRHRRRAGEWNEPIGVLTHHLDHDEAAWAFLDRFLAFTGGARGPGKGARCHWRCSTTLLQLKAREALSLVAPHRMSADVQA